MKYFKNKIVDGFIPGENCLILNVGPWDNKGFDITASAIDWLILSNKECTAIVFRGGDKDPDEINQIAQYIRNEFPKIKIAWFSNEDYLSSWIKLPNFDYIKIGSFNAGSGDYRVKGSNQRIYKIRKVRGGYYKLHDISEKFYV